MRSNTGREAPPDIRGVLFDLDDTLYNRGLAFHAWATDFVAENLPSMDEDDREAAVAFLVEADDGGYRPRPQFVATVYRRFPSLPRQSADDFVSDFRVGMLTKIELEAGARSLLDTLTARGMPWGIVTNGSTAPQQRKIDHLDLTDSATCILISETFGAKKPHPGIFKAAAHGLGVEADDVLFVGDHIVNDISGAQQAGMRTAWLRRGRQWPADLETPPDFVVDDLRELIPLLIA